MINPITAECDYRRIPYAAVCATVVEFYTTSVFAGSYFPLAGEFVGKLDTILTPNSTIFVIYFIYYIFYWYYICHIYYKSYF